MKKFIGNIKRVSTSSPRGEQPQPQSVPSLQANGRSRTLPYGDAPDAVIVREVTAFCEAGAPGSNSAGEEYLHLPAIVDAAESSPAAAKEAANIIRKYLTKENHSRGYAQYNAIMLCRILTDNPGRAFTQNFDKSFISTVKELLRKCSDSSVQQIMRETLDYFEAQKLRGNETLTPLIEMWRREKGSGAQLHQRPVVTHRDPMPPTQPSRSRGLPPPDELAARVEEAKTSARLLVQMIQSTPPHEVLGNELIKEFAERAKSANKSIQHYMSCENPAPDEDTLLTLIETSEQLNISMTRHQRAILQARKAYGSTGSSPQPQQVAQDPFSTAQMQKTLPQKSLSPEPRVSALPQKSLSPEPRISASPAPLNPENRLASPPPNFAPPAATWMPTRRDTQTEEMFLPPSGPPSFRRPSDVSDVPPAMKPGTPPRAAERQQTLSSISPSSPVASREYGVAENPFSDEAYAVPQQNSYSLFSRAAGQLRGSPNPTPPPLQENYQEPYNKAIELPASRPSATTGWEPTHSYLNRQESAGNNITMHGASPEPK